MRLPSPDTLGLPFADWRPQQAYAMKRAGRTSRKFLVLQLPTGAGKSGIALGLLRQSPHRGFVLTSTKSLQDQYGATASWLTDIRGMGNYECLAARDAYRRYFPRRSWVGCDEGPCRSEFACGLKESGCTFFDADREMRAARFVVTSYSKWLSSRRFANGLGAAPLLVCDEAHHLASELMSACRIEIPHHELGRTKRPRTIAQWKQWAAGRGQQLKLTTEDPEVRLRRRTMIDKVDAMAFMDPATWAWEETTRGFAFEPVVPRRLLPLLCGDEQRTVVFLSATVTPEVLALVGVPEDDMEFLAFPSTFPVHRRPVYCVRTARVDYRMTQADWRYVVETADEIIGGRLDRKGLVHSVSYDRGADFYRRSTHKSVLLLHQRGEPLADVLAIFDRRPAPLVLISPVITTGHDFAFRRAEYQILLKTPFPDTRSVIARARIEATPESRDATTMQTVVQIVGRVDRDEADQGETFILDDHFRDWFFRKARVYAPDWFQEAVYFEDKGIPRPPRRLAA